jgi:hypothetical protein
MQDMKFSRSKYEIDISTLILKAILSYAGDHGHLELRGIFSKPKKGE